MRNAISVAVIVALIGMSADANMPAVSDCSPDTFHARVMYWANPQLILCKEWYVVVMGTVIETHKTRYPDLAKQRFTEGTLRVERVLLRLPTRQESVPPTMKYFKSDGFEDLRRGDKVVVFVNEYDGGYGIIEAAGSNCKLGIKLRDWSDAIVGAIGVIAGDEKMATRPSERKSVLREPKYLKLWQLYSRKVKGEEACWEWPQ